MSKFSRTRKAICRIGKLNNWIITRGEFKKYPIKSFKVSYKELRKTCIEDNTKFYSSVYKDYIKTPCKYKDALNAFTIYLLPL